jgi:hypothetical protein
MLPKVPEELRGFPPAGAHLPIKSAWGVRTDPKIRVLSWAIFQDLAEFELLTARAGPREENLGPVNAGPSALSGWRET